ncbi:Hypothetical protein A7982_08137 [Minicystis rosea]|nr:Hypothetical protein A7982_08137 [Minicystis rosea]
MSPSEQDLSVANAREDKARRLRLASMMVGMLVAVVALLVQAVTGGWAPLLLSLVILAGGYFVMWRAGLLARAQAMLQIGAIRREGLAATARLKAADIDGARRAYAELLRKARPLGAFHAVHVLMYGITCFLEGDAKEGLRLTTRVLESGWLDVRPTRKVRDEAEQWRILMLLHQGELAAARERVEASPGADLLVASVAVSVFEKRWSEVIEHVQKALGNPRTEKAARPTLAAMGIFAARKLDRADVVEELGKVLAAEPVGALTRKNPSLSPFLDT